MLDAAEVPPAVDDSSDSESGESVPEEWFSCGWLDMYMFVLEYLCGDCYRRGLHFCEWNVQTNMFLFIPLFNVNVWYCMQCKCVFDVEPYIKSNTCPLYLA